MANWKKGDIITAEALNGAGGDEPSYEVVAEIPVGEMEKVDEGQYSFTAINVAVPTIDTSATYYLNNSENPSSNVKLVEGNPFLLFNAADPDDFHPEDPSKPLVGLAYNGQEQTCLVLSDTPDLSNTTVRILKQVEQGGGAAGKIVVHLTKSEVEGIMVYSADKTVAEIIAADAAGQVVECEYDMCLIPLFSCHAESKMCLFSVLIPTTSTNIDALVISAASEDGVDSWTVDKVEYVQVPTFDTTEDLGKVLTVTANRLAWVTPT